MLVPSRRAYAPPAPQFWSEVGDTPTPPGLEDGELGGHPPSPPAGVRPCTPGDEGGTRGDTGIPATEARPCPPGEDEDPGDIALPAAGALPCVSEEARSATRRSVAARAAAVAAMTAS